MAGLRKEIEETEWAIEQNERKYNIDKVSHLKYEVLPGKGFTCFVSLD
jgi:hypothetical protein